VRALHHRDAACGDALGHAHAHLPDLFRLQAADEGDRAAQRMPLEQGIHVVGQGVVDRRLDVAVEAQHALPVLLVRAVRDVVGQHLRLPAGESLLWRKCSSAASLDGQRLLRLRLTAPGEIDPHQLRALGGAQRVRLPAAQERRVQQQHPARQLRVACGAHRTEEAAQRMAHQEGGFAGLVDLARGEVVQLLHQPRPVVADRVLRIVAELVDGLDREAACAQVPEQDAVGAGGKAVGVREDDQAQISFSSGRVIFFSGLLRPPTSVRSGMSVCVWSQTGSSRLSNTSRSFWPQPLCSMRK
jgi:hypothetical protein